MIIRHFIESPAGPVEIPSFAFCHEGGGPHRSCDSCFALVEGDGRLVHAAGCGAAKPLAGLGEAMAGMVRTDAAIVDDHSRWLDDGDRAHPGEE